MLTFGRGASAMSAKAISRAATARIRFFVSGIFAYSSVAIGQAASTNESGRVSLGVEANGNAAGRNSSMVPAPDLGGGHGGLDRSPSASVLRPEPVLIRRSQNLCVTEAEILNC